MHTQKPFLQKFPVRAFDAIVASPGAEDGLVPSCVGATGGPNWKVGFCRADVTLSGPGDSFYEYLLKQWILLTKAGRKRQNSKGEIPVGKYWGASGASSSSFEKLFPEIRKNDVGNDKPSDADLEAAESYRLMWVKAMKQMWYRLVSRTDVGTVYIGVLRASGSWEPVMEHLACFVPGMLMLGVESEAVDVDDWDFVPAVGEAGWGGAGSAGAGADDQAGVRWADRFRQLAKDLTETCVRMYTHTASGLAPEAMRFRDSGHTAVSEKLGIKLPGMLGGGKHPDMEFMSGYKYNLLRPETVESLFYMWYYTGDDKYRQYGRDIFDAFEKYSKTEFGFTALDGVHLENTKKLTPKDGGRMETFWIAETLKYLYLLFSPSNTVDLEKTVFTTEAHPLDVF